MFGHLDRLYPQEFCTLPSFARIKRPRWRPVELNDRHPQSYGKIKDCERSNMIATAKEKGGFIDQETFKTAGKYGFDSLILTDANLQVLNGCISYVRPLLNPSVVSFSSTEMEFNTINWVRSCANWCSMQLKSTSIPRVIAKLLKRRASISSPAKSRGFCRKTNNTALLLLKLTSKSKEPEKLL